MSPRWQEDSGTFELVDLFELVEFLAFAWGRHLEAVCWLSRLEVQERLGLVLLVALGRNWYYIVPLLQLEKYFDVGII